MGLLSSPAAEISDHEETNLQNTSKATVAKGSITDARAAESITASWMGRPTVGKVINPGVDFGVHDARTEGGEETWDRR